MGLSITKINAQERKELFARTGVNIYTQGTQYLIEIGDHWLLANAKLAKMLQEKGTKTEKYLHFQSPTHWDGTEGQKYYYLRVTMESAPNFEATLVLQNA